MDGVRTYSCISIHSLRMEGDAADADVQRQAAISIHSLRMEGDRDRLTAARQFLYFNPLPPHGGRLIAHINQRGCLVISIHSLRMEGDFLPQGLNTLIIWISIHSLRMEGDWTRCGSHASRAKFQSTPSAWRETVTPNISPYEDTISIHSLRMEGDQRSQLNNAAGRNFNPLPPHGGRLRCSYAINN